MTPQNMSTSKLMAVLALCAAVIAVVAFCLPMASVETRYMSFERNGLDLVDTDGTGGTGMSFGLVGAVVAVTFAALGLGNRKRLVVAASGAAAGAAGVLIAFIAEDVMEYAAFGFWLFVVMEAACLILSCMGLNKSKAE